LDHTTNQSYFNDVDLLKISSPRRGFLAFWMIVSCFTIVGIPLVFIYVIVQKTQHKRFTGRGMAPLWKSAGVQAAAIGR
jgi:hypothetical protein